MVKKAELKKIFKPEQYRVDLFKELGHIRSQCSKCGIFFWTLDSERNTCGETECDGGYKFIGRTGPNWDFHQTLNKLTSFFKRNGHTPIDPYPVVARWRDDLEFTIASIATFQPYVTSGALKPQANPLTIAQPCLRFGGEFNDLDNIGRTGRHLSSFIMFGQHAFNGEGLEGGYWMDRCIELNFNFLTKELKIEPEELTYTENIWMGGGNFGPNLESMAYGTEIVNSVFMQYENLPGGKYKEMDLKVIDVGWGGERVSWFSQGTPTIYEATFGKVWDYMQKESGLEYDKKLVEDYAVLAGFLDVNEITDIKSARSGIANQLGMTLDQLNAELAGIEGLYQLGDHARTISFALADGAIPSNAGGGYNVRTVMRRMFTINELLDLNMNLTELIRKHALYLSKSYPKLKGVDDFLDTIVDVERSRYHKTLESGQRYVKQLISDKKKIPNEKLLELYESRGIGPETVQAIAKQLGTVIEVPADFYNQLGMKEVKEDNLKASEFNLQELKQYKTVKRYYEIPYHREWKATVLAILDTGHLILDETILYPTGGGQEDDRGIIKAGRSNYNVIDVKKYGDAVLHKLDREPTSLKVGSKVKIILDWDRREACIRHHTGVHIVGGAAREIIGSHVWQAGADKTHERGRLDITHWELPSREVLDQIEIRSNEIVMQNLEVFKHTMKRNKAEQEYGFIIYQGGVVPGEEVRIIEIPKLDVQACGGTHAHLTGEVGYIKVMGAERIQDGIIRITLTAGKKAVLSAQHQYQLLSKSASEFKVTPEELPMTSERFFREWKDRGKVIDKLKHELAESRVPILIQSAEEVEVNGSTMKLIVVRQDGSQQDLIKLGDKLANATKEASNFISVILGQDGDRAVIVVARSQGSKYNLNGVIRGLGQIVGGGGGGNKDVVSGGGSKPENIPDALNKAKQIIIDNIK
jgi:alanyl-tRNA synthetase